MGSAEKFCLRWNDFESNISVAFRELREDKDFFDVTLACDDNQVQAHKVILSACSPFFRTILKRNRHEHPLLYLKGVKYTDLMAVLNFMYHGEVSVAQEELNSFLAIAEDLKVKGLTQNKSEDIPRQRKEVPKARPRDPPEIPEPTPQPKRACPVTNPSPVYRMNITQPQYQAEDDDIQEVVPVKAEPACLPPEHPQSQGQEDYHGQDSSVTNSMAMYEENYDDYENYDDATEAAYDGGMVAAANADGNKALEQAISSSMSLVYDEVSGVKVWQCLYCHKTHKYKSFISRHVESHMEGQSHTCSICHKSYKTKLSLEVHMTQKHRKPY